MTRLPLTDLHSLTPDQKSVAERIASGPRGEVRGPVRLWLHSPQLADIAQALGAFLRWNTVLAPRISELVILVTARHYTCHYIWFNHVGIALNAGLSADAVEAIKQRGDPRPFLDPDETIAFTLTDAILSDVRVDDGLVDRARSVFGDRGVVELSTIIGHYHSGSILLSLSDVSLPDGNRACLPLP
jgi:4-carboxymuconolactone decarboxylase